MKQYMIIGYGGIGSALAEKIQDNNNKLIIVSRKQEIPLDTITKISFDDLADFFKQTLPDYIINTIGILHDATHQPEKNINQLSLDWLEESIKINTMPTAQIAQHLNAVMKRDSTLKMLSISARVSSISDNHLGGWYSYRMSKAALNMLIKNIAIEWSRQYPNAVIAAYHPGTVDTDLSKPFQSRIPPEQLFSPDRAANYLLNMLDQLTAKDSGKLIDWKGKTISF